MYVVIARAVYAEADQVLQSRYFEFESTSLRGADYPGTPSDDSHTYAAAHNFAEQLD